MISILEEAAEVRKDRAARVDDPAGNFARIAKIWEVVFGHTVTTKQVALAMIGVKLARECYKPWRDNLVDLAGYADCAAEIEGYYGDTDGPVCGDGPQDATGSNASGQVIVGGEVGTGEGDGKWSLCTKHDCGWSSWYGTHSHRICT